MVQREKKDLNKLKDEKKNPNFLQSWIKKKKKVQK
jgi:hypothetical protein